MKRQIPLRGAGARQVFVNEQIDKARRLGAVVVTLKERGITPAELAAAGTAAGLVVRIEGMKVFFARQPAATEKNEQLADTVKPQRKFRISRPLRTAS